MDVTFFLAPTADERYAETDLADPAILAAAAPALLALDAFTGGVRLTHPGQPDVELTDDLPPLVLDLCFGVPASLGDGGPVEYDFASRFDEVVFTPDGETVRLTGDDVDPPRSYPAAELAAELRDCGRRFATFFAGLTAGSADWAEVSSALTRAAGRHPDE